MFTIKTGESPCAAMCMTVNPCLLIAYISAPFYSKKKAKFEFPRKTA